jgi:hypothetical protein
LGTANTNSSDTPLCLLFLKQDESQTTQITDSAYKSSKYGIYVENNVYFCVRQFPINKSALLLLSIGNNCIMERVHAKQIENKMLRLREEQAKPNRQPLTHSGGFLCSWKVNLW